MLCTMHYAECTLYSRGGQPFVVGGPKNEKIVRLFLLRAILYIFFANPLNFW